MFPWTFVFRLVHDSYNIDRTILTRRAARNSNLKQFYLGIPMFLLPQLWQPWIPLRKRQKVKLKKLPARPSPNKKRATPPQQTSNSFPNCWLIVPYDFNFFSITRRSSVLLLARSWTLYLQLQLPFLCGVNKWVSSYRIHALVQYQIEIDFDGPSFGFMQSQRSQGVVSKWKEYYAHESIW